MILTVKGILRNLAGRIIGNAIQPTLGMDADGGIFATITATTSGAILLATTSNAITDGASEVVAASSLTETLEFFNKDTANSVFINWEGVTATITSWEILPQAYYTPPSITRGAVSAVCAAGLTATLLINRGT